MRTLPTLVQYQGSKRKLAPAILEYMPRRSSRLVEPFCGMASVTFAVAQKGMADSFWLNDLNKDVIAVLQTAIEEPDELIARYGEVWEAQFADPEGHVHHFFRMRDIYNEGNADPAVFLYLVARCVKGAVRYSANGMNQSPDKRRHGTKPSTMAANIRSISGLLKGRTRFTSMDYGEVLAQCGDGDMVYMDPPYQGTSGKKDSRYISGVSVDDLEAKLRDLDARGVNYLLSYDGVCGDKNYGRELADDLKCSKMLLNAGRSAQATLLGRKDVTYEALYLSERLAAAHAKREPVTLFD